MSFTRFARKDNYFHNHTVSRVLKLWTSIVLSFLVLNVGFARAESQINQESADYILDLTTHESRLFSVTATFSNRPGNSTLLRLPAWSPGSYLIREYSQNILSFHATDEYSNPLKMELAAKDRWKVLHDDGATIQIQYEIYGGTLSVRTPYITSTRACWTPTALFVTPLDEEFSQYKVEVILPDSWEANMLMDRDEGTENVWTANTLDQFYDAAGIAGPLETHHFEYGGKDHFLIFDGPANYDAVEIVEKLKKTVEATEKIFRGNSPLPASGISPILPYPEYTFLVSLEPKHGGLEHLRGTHLVWPRHEFRTEEDIQDFMSLCAHEYFHLWNVKRIRPEPLGPFNYQEENYTRNLWIVEGITSYYDLLIPARAGIYDTKKLFKQFEKEIHRLQASPGRIHQTLEASSQEAWIKFYRAEENFRNSQISYYNKGALVALLLDGHLRQETNGEKNLDDVMRTLWHDYQTSGKGYEERGGFEDAVLRTTGVDVTSMLDDYIRDTVELNYAPWLELMGLKFEHPEKPEPWLGIDWSVMDGRIFMKTVRTGTPAGKAGLSNGDELIAIDDYRVLPGKYQEFLSRMEIGEKVQFMINRDRKIYEYEVTFAADPFQYKLKGVENPSEQQVTTFETWCGLEHPTETEEKSDQGD
ncbi:PDZ domain-containing protein [bacterium]|nr:PDZ domain-containing protein [bacterium]